MVDFTVMAVVGLATTGYCFHAGTTVPDPYSSLSWFFATEGASVLGVLADFNFHHFPEGGAITGPVFTNDTDLLGAFSLLREKPAILRPRNGDLPGTPSPGASVTIFHPPSPCLDPALPIPSR